ncbi:MAG: restriction endonuclease subunit S [Candidatus Aminicenantes bacterium]|nr:restriction endonuclease subunit S [Candidatus Aminicenantes bacterium]
MGRSIGNTYKVSKEQNTPGIERRRFRPYPEYKDSGVEWLGEIPMHWEARRLKFVLSAPLKYGANEAAELEELDLPRYVRITDIDENDSLRDETFKSLPDEVAKEYLLREGDILFARSGATAGKTFLYRKTWGTCAYAGYLIRARLNNEIAFPEFIRFFTSSLGYWQWLASVFIQATIQNVSAERYASLSLPLPALSEQHTIAVFLDRETAKIDALIEKKERLIDLLHEKRTALITQAVTKGLDPTVPTKDSGVEWLGIIPALWEAYRIKSLTKEHKQGFYTEQTYIDEGVKLARISDIDDRANIHFDNMPYVSIDSKDECTFRLLEGDILFARSGTIGRFGIVCGTERAVFASYLIRFRFSKVHVEFLRYAFDSKYFKDSLVSSLHGGANQNVHAENIKALTIALPPRDEQPKITAYLLRETAKIDTLVAKVYEAIDRLKEYRTALISAAVTGKIDVREA